MKKLTVILGQKEVVEGINLDVSLKEFRSQLASKGFTEVALKYVAGQYVMTFITGKVSRLGLIDAGLIKGSKNEREEYKSKTKDSRTKINNFGYAY